MLLGTTMVLTRKFDPENALRAGRARVRFVRRSPSCSSGSSRCPRRRSTSTHLPRLKAVASSGSALPGDLPTQWMDRFGDNLYSIYGSTEVAWASIATPQDLREAPGSAGGIPHATVVKILDPDGKELPVGESGRIFVGNDLQFEGYTGGGHKEMVDGLMSTGDVGRFADDGRLYVGGPRRRDDRLRRGERLPQGGRRLHLDASTASPRSPRSASMTTTTGSGCVRSWSCADGASLSEDDVQELGQVQPGPLQGAARHRLPRRAAAQRDRQGPQARAGRSAPRWISHEVIDRLGSRSARCCARLHAAGPVGQDVTLSSYRGQKAVGADPVRPVSPSAASARARWRTIRRGSTSSSRSTPRWWRSRCAPMFALRAFRATLLTSRCSATSGRRRGVRAYGSSTSGPASR